MSTINHIGLDTEKSQALAIQLNDLLANFQIFYINVRGFHWNIQGEKFFELHVKFEELYQDLFLKIDEIAERIVTLGITPLHSYTSYLQQAEIKEAENISNGKDAINNILATFKTLLAKERAILQLAGDADDEGTNALMSDYIREQEKLVWMYVAYLK